MSRRDELAGRLDMGAQRILGTAVHASSMTDGSTGAKEKQSGERLEHGWVRWDVSWRGEGRSTVERRGKNRVGEVAAFLFVLREANPVGSFVFFFFFTRKGAI